MSIIQVQNLVKKYNGITAVNGISFEVRQGELFGFLGPNGAGKTTTINILCTLLSATDGTAIVNGYDCKKKSSDVRASIGLVFQETTLDNDLTAYENLKFHCYLYNMKRKETEERIKEVLQVVELYDRKDDLVRRFSGGMKRRLEIVRGLLHRPKVLFLDEPTLGLDPQTRMNIWAFIDNLRRKEGITVFMTTHYMDEAEVCSRIAIIDHGNIIACGTPDELKKKIRGDTVYIKTSDDAKAFDEIERGFDIRAARLKDGIALNVESGEKFIPKIFEALTTEILSINLKKPTLDDVFINLTGREIREDNNNKGSELFRIRKRG
ncbi:MAG: ABC transporter ATP-binding protein [Deltaproteobacteria bacterium GWC2_42_11]|nr:MAG: ABC transporter ATP-binding protein [Deltaproteobacteria bacterium GWC2_42_11]